MLRKLVKAIIPARLFELIEPYGHLLEAVLANIINGFPARKLKVVGVTGTDGKTTTATLIAAMLRHAGIKTGMFTTIAIDTGNGPEPNPTRLTSVSPWDLQSRLRAMVKNGVEWVVLETTSHALAQYRVWGVPYKVAVMTNVTHEHLDYHKTFERYRDAKLKLFELAGRGGGVGIVNAADPSAGLFAGAVPTAFRYGLETGDFIARDVVTDSRGSTYTAAYGGKEVEIRINLPGSFNVLNSLAAAAAGSAIGLSRDQIRAGLASLETVEGRMNTVDEGQEFTVIVDYAHTPDSFKKIFSEIRPVTKGRMICVFGSAGRRDEAKRPRQGKIAGEMCDLVIVTEEDDRDVDGLKIMDEIAAGAEEAGKQRGKDLWLIHDRAGAIAKAVELAQPADTLLLLGKGHEKSILTNAGKKDWDETEEARKAIRSRLKITA